MTPETAIVGSYVGGRPILTGGVLSALSWAELAERVRAAKAIQAP